MGWLVMLASALPGCTKTPTPTQPQPAAPAADATSGAAAAPPRPTVKVAEHPVQANLPAGDPRAWQSGVRYQPPHVSPLTAQEIQLQRQVQAAGGRFQKRAVTDDERQANATLGVQLTGDAIVAVDMDRMKSSGKLAMVDNLDGVHELGLSRSDVNDADLQQLVRAKDLIELDLNFTHVTDAGLIYLEGLKNLRFLIVENTGVTASGVQRLKQINPRLRIFHSSTHGANED